MRCIANPTRLKELYGIGYKLFANYLEPDSSKVKNFLDSLLPPGNTVTDLFATSIVYEFSVQGVKMGSIFETIEQNKSNYGILDWGFGQTTLEEVFVKLIKDDEA